MHYRNGQNNKQRNKKRGSHIKTKIENNYDNSLPGNCCDPDPGLTRGVLVPGDELHVTPAPWHVRPLLVGHLKEDGHGGVGGEATQLPLGRVANAYLHLSHIGTLLIS